MLNAFAEFNKNIFLYFSKLLNFSLRFAYIFKTILVLKIGF